MKKVLSLILAILMVMSLAILPVSAADDSCPFVKIQRAGDRYFVLRADGVLYDFSPVPKFFATDDETKDSFTVRDTSVSDVLCDGFFYSTFKKDYDYPVYYDCVEEYGETIRFERQVGENLFQSADGSIFRVYGSGAEYQLTTDTVTYATADFFLTASGELYDGAVYDDCVLVAENVVDFCHGEYDGDMFYRTTNGDLYKYTEGQYENVLLMKNCSSLYNYRFAKDNNGNWYHIGYNTYNRLEPEKFVDGNNITPERFDEFVKASTYILKEKNLEWKLDGDVYLNDEFLIGNVIYVVVVNDTIRIVTESGAVYVLFETDESYGEYEYCYGDFTNTGLVMKNPIGCMRENGMDTGVFITENNGLAYVDASYGEEYYGAYEIKGSKYLTRSDWAVAELTAADEAGFIDSVKNLEMRRNITRLEFCNMIVDFAETIKGEKLSTVSKNPFEDVEGEEAVLKAYASGIIAGISATEFNPNGNITREQMCAIMTRTIKYLNPAVSFGTPIQFTDMTSVSDWAVEGVNAMSGLGIVKGDGVSINPQSQTTIEQAIAMTYRLYGKMK